MILDINNISTNVEISTQNKIEIEKPKELFKRLNYLYPEFQNEYILNNGLKITNKRLFLRGKNKCNEIIGYDTETYKGSCKLLACSKGKYIFNPTFEQCIKFLFYLANKSGIYRFFFNIDFDFTSILKLWKSKFNICFVNNRIKKKIAWLKDGIEVKYKDYKIKWLKGRMLIIKHIYRKKSVIFTDIFNFFHTSLNKSATKYLTDVKIDDIDGNKLNNSLDYWKKREKDIIKYCIQDCKLTEKLGKVLIDTIIKCNIPLPRYLVSSASLSKQDFRKNCYMTSINQVPKKILQIAYNCYYGGRFEILKRGFFKKVYLYDINSQYPTFIKEMPNLRDGVWKKTKYIPNRPCMAYYLVKVDIPNHYKIPTVPIHHKGVNKFPNGKIKKWMTWYDLDLIRNFIVKVYDGYRFLKSNKFKPFEKRINELYEQKAKLKGIFELGYNITKLDMNAVYGCFIETHKNYDKKGNYDLTSGILFNSVYASQITAFGRWSVLKDIPKKLYKHILAIHTDSIISDIPLDKYLKIDDKLGNWNKESKDNSKGIILNTGMYQIGSIVKTRGIPKKFIKNWLRFCLENNIYIKKKFKIKHMRKLAEGLIRDKSLINVNTITDQEKSVNCNSDTKRDWLIDFKSFRDVLSKNIDSYPYICYFNPANLHPNPLCIAHRYEVNS